MASSGWGCGGAGRLQAEVMSLTLHTDVLRNVCDRYPQSFLVFIEERNAKGIILGQLQGLA